MRPPSLHTLPQPPRQDQNGDRQCATPGEAVEEASGSERTSNAYGAQKEKRNTKMRLMRRLDQALISL